MSSISQKELETMSEALLQRAESKAKDAYDYAKERYTKLSEKSIEQDCNIMKYEWTGGTRANYFKLHPDEPEITANMLNAARDERNRTHLELATIQKELEKRKQNKGPGAGDGLSRNDFPQNSSDSFSMNSFLRSIIKTVSMSGKPFDLSKIFSLRR